MIYDAADFVFQPAPELSRARRVLVKPSAAYPIPYPVTTSRETLALIIRGIRRVSDADIILLEGAPSGDSLRSIFRTLGYDFPRVIVVDVKDCVLVEVENPLPKHFAMPNFWVPNILLACDYLITVAPFKVVGGKGRFSLDNLLGLLPLSKYGEEAPKAKGLLQRLSMPNIIADLYFTLPFDLGIIDARLKFLVGSDPTKGEIEEFGKIYVGEPFEVDSEASLTTGIEVEYLPFIAAVKGELESYDKE